MPYPEPLIAPMREDLTRFGVEEARTVADVDRLLAPGNGTVLMIVNSICGCAAGRARPAVGMALQHSVRPANAATVFAGADEAAVARVRAILSGYPPSSPSMALFRDGQSVYVLHRSDIERRDPFEIADLLKTAFDRFCGPNMLNQKTNERRASPCGAGFRPAAAVQAALCCELLSQGAGRLGGLLCR